MIRGRIHPLREGKVFFIVICECEKGYEQASYLYNQHLIIVCKTQFALQWDCTSLKLVGK